MRIGELFARDRELRERRVGLRQHEHQVRRVVEVRRKRGGDEGVVTRSGFDDATGFRTVELCWVRDGLQSRSAIFKAQGALKIVGAIFSKLTNLCKWTSLPNFHGADWSGEVLVAQRPASREVFSETERAALAMVRERLGGKTSKRLSELSHKEPAWAGSETGDRIAYRGAERLAALQRQLTVPARVR